ncbi:MAG: hypothetical protein AAF787_03505 [Chloroflexota bacterium]
MNPDVLTYPFFASVVMAVVTGIFAFLVMRSWWQKRRPHLFAWGFGLTLYFVASFAQVWLKFAWDPTWYRLWYWCGALMIPPWLGQGTIFLLVRRGSIARNTMAALVLVSAMTFVFMFITPLTPPMPWPVGADLVMLTDEIMPSFSGSVRGFVPITNGLGTLMLVGGAIYSARLFAAKQIMRNRVIGNWFIAIGGLLPATGGYFIRLDMTAFKYTADLLGVVLIFVGYVFATRVPKAVNEARAAKQARKEAQPT